MTVDNTLPTAIIHRLPHYNKLPLRWANDIFNPIEPSDPLYSIHRPSARIIIIIGSSPVKSEQLDQYPSVECVIGTIAGVDHIDLAECRRRNIRVTSAGSAFSEDGADYAIGLLMDVLRRVSAADRFVRAGLWPVKGDYPLGNKVYTLIRFVVMFFSTRVAPNFLMVKTAIDDKFASNLPPYFHQTYFIIHP
ncbi:hypothetical protein E3N88_30496 [Mikania micrantha]|uniref:D-isomer specific 2-hydroxyacid dehydrogenase catalytic domain-containing protein n=1 Tax=Mikania micrantha TaxID=192012 RepID=A0A5N6MMJ2_9ASTR|nr:hypothetical protein E3N88_30496 [Mikania micrantha]